MVIFTPYHHHCCRANLMPIAFDLWRGADALAVWMIVSISGRFAFRFLVSVLSVFYFSLVSCPSFFDDCQTIEGNRLRCGCPFASSSPSDLKGCEKERCFHFLPPLRLFESARRINRESGPPGVTGRSTGPWSIASPGVGRTSTQQGKGRTGAHALMGGLANISF
jgi:hypothetical protein